MITSRTLSRHLRWLATACAVAGYGGVALGVAACGDSGSSSAPTQPAVTSPPPPVAQTASVSGTVVLSGTTTPLAGVTVTVGAKSATTNAAGSFTIPDAPVGNNIAITASLTGYEKYSSTLTVSVTGGTQRINLRRQTLFEAAAGSIYIAPGTVKVRGVVLGIFTSVSSRGFATGNPASGSADADLAMSMSRQALLPLADSAQGVALMGAVQIGTLGGDPAPAIRQALAEVAAMSGHDELANAPLLVYAMSAASPTAMRIVRDLSDQVAGFFLGVPAGMPNLTDAMLSIPGYVSLAKGDTAVNNALTQEVVVSARARGARWALAVEPGRSHFTSTASGEYFDVLRGWMAAVLERRAGPPGRPTSSLTVLLETSGWLGDPGSFAIAPWASFAGARTSASWLPTPETAQLWQAQSTRKP